MLLELLTNTALNTDTYKTSQYKQYPPGTKHINSYIESRGGVYPNVMSFGLQGLIKEYLMKPMTMEDIDIAEKYIDKGLNAPFNREGWEYIVKQHGGYMPVSIETVAEGTVLPGKNVTTQIINNDDKCEWLTSYLETALIRSSWYSNTVATKSWHTKQIIRKHMEETCDDLSGMPFKLNDFGARAATSGESAALGGMSHLVNFTGSDTIMGVVAANVYYDYQPEKQGVPASEHSTMTSWGKEHEADAYRNMLKQFSGEGKIVAVVSDSYDYLNALENIWGGELKEEVINNGGLVVIRPDSGDPVEIICQSLDILSDKFGTSLNKKGYKLLPPYIRLIQGDGVSPDKIDEILTAMKDKGYSADNVNFGMGGELLQKLDRDTQKYAMKASARGFIDAEPVMSDFKKVYATPEEQWMDVFKDPVTDPGKTSKKGILALTWDDNAGYITCRASELDGRKNLLETVYSNGKLLKDLTFDQVRETAAETTQKLYELNRKGALPRGLGFTPFTPAMAMAA